MSTDEQTGAGTALAKQEEPTAVELADRAMQRRAVMLAKAEGLLPKPLQNKPAEVYLILHKAEGLGIPEGEALANLYPIEGRLVPSAQLQAALIRRAGHRLQIVELSRERCVVKARRHDDAAGDWVTVDYTIDDARDSGLLDQWVERWIKVEGRNRKETVIVGNDEGLFLGDNERAARGLAVMPDWAKQAVKAGQVKRRDNWWKFRRDMLRARCITFIGRSMFSDCLLGIGDARVWSDDEVDRAEARLQAQKRGEPDPFSGSDDQDDDEDIEDAELVDDDQDEKPTEGGEGDVTADPDDAGGLGAGQDPDSAPGAEPEPATLYDASDPERPFTDGEDAA